MENKKTLILGVVIILVLAGMFWYFNGKINTEEQAASMVDTSSADQQIGAVEKIPVEEIEDIILGSPDAPVALIEYSNHLCGHCANFHSQVLPLIMEEYVKTGKVKLIPRLLSPIELGLTVFCAQEQGKFQEMNEYLFEHVQEIEIVDDLRVMAGTVGLNREEFDICLDSSKYENGVVKWFEDAQEVEVGGTPTFFVNEERIDGSQTFSEFKKIIEKELEKADEN